MFKKKESPEQTMDKVYTKYEKMGYSRELIKLAISKCEKPYKEASMIEILKNLKEEQTKKSQQKQNQPNENYINQLFQKYGQMGYKRNIIEMALSQCRDISSESAMIETLNYLTREANANYAVDQKYSLFVKNALKKYGELGYSQEIINTALVRCPNVYNENSMLDTLNMLTRESSYPPRVFK